MVAHMKPILVYSNNTSPFARIARIALLETQAYDVRTQIVDPWSDDPALVRANPAARVPAVVTPRGNPLTESLLVILWLQSGAAKVSFLGTDAETVIMQAGFAIGVIEAVVSILVGRKITGIDFDESKLGLRRRRTIVNGLGRLNADIPEYAGSTPSLAVIATIVAIDYVELRLSDRSWLNPFAGINELRSRAADRPSFASTVPFI
jgi:glutathione S-transferase